MKPIIEIRDLRKKFKKIQAIDGLNLTVPEGAVTAFLGPNGAGKTTTIKCLLNMVRPDGGTIELLGQSSRRLRSDAFRTIGYVSENQELPLWMTVQQFIDYCQPMYPNWDVDFAKKLLQQFELPLAVKLKDCSRGMRMKAALLCSLAYHPKLVVLDEPFSGLDPLVREEFIRGMLELTGEEGWTVFVSSHDISEVERMADRVAILNGGQLQIDESAEELLSRFRSVEVMLGQDAILPTDVPKSWLNAELSGRVLRFTDSHFSPATLHQDLSKYLFTTDQLAIAPMSIREIFIVLAKKFRLSGLVIK